MNTLERHCFAKDHIDSSFSQGVYCGSPLSTKKSKQFDYRRPNYRQQHEPSEQGECIHKDDEVRELKLKLESIEAEIAVVRDVADDALSKCGKRCGLDTTKEQEKLLNEIKALKQKVRNIGESTSQSCQTLAASVADMQQSTLNIYAWADRAYTAFGVVSEKLNLRPNVCPRIYAHTVSPERRASAEFLDNLASFNKASLGTGTARLYR